MTLRFGCADDENALARLAELDSAGPPAQPVLLAEIDGQLLAALALTDGSVVADPFHRTADLIDLLRARARQLDGNRRPRRPFGVRAWSRLRAPAWRQAAQPAVQTSGPFVEGSGVVDSGLALIENSTIAHDMVAHAAVAFVGENLGVLSVAQSAVSLRSTIIAGGGRFGDCGSSTLRSLAHNLDSDGTCELSGDGDYRALTRDWGHRPTTGVRRTPWRSSKAARRSTPGRAAMCSPMTNAEERGHRAPTATPARSSPDSPRR